MQALILGDCREVLAAMEPESVDAIVTDPPYELGFMGKTWDARGVSFDPETWRAAHRVLKPGGHLLAFGGTRTFHRIAVAIEDAGFEIRDCLSWLYGSGFPKSHNVGDGIGTALKPAWEPVIVARKPLCGTVAQNVARHGTGGINVDACRIAGQPWKAHDATGLASVKYFTDGDAKVIHKEPHTAGRWPANVALDEAAAAMLDEMSGERKSGESLHDRSTVRLGVYGQYTDGRNTAREPDTGGASRFFYVAKASRSERNAGLEGMPERMTGMSNGAQLHGDGYDKAQGIGLNRVTAKANHHPTVKPVALMRWLVRLVTPPGGTVCDPFTGSGTTGIAATLEGFAFVGIEREPEYLDIAARRILHAAATAAVPDHDPQLTLAGLEA